jgi:hypothetical protein
MDILPAQELSSEKIQSSSLFSIVGGMESVPADVDGC